MPLDLSTIVDDYDWEQAFSVAAQPDYVKIDPKVDIEEVIASIDGESDGPNWQAVIKLKDNGKFGPNRYAWVSSGCDYTGWDCQAGGSIMLSETLEKLFNPYFMDRSIREEFSPILEKATGLKVRLDI